MSKKIELQVRDNQMVDLLIEKDGGNTVLILMSNKEDWKRLKFLCNIALKKIDKM